MIAWLAFLVLAATDAPQAAAKAASPPALTQAEADAALAKVLPELEAIRGLKFKSKVPAEVVDVARARAYARSRFEATTPAPKIAADQRAYELLGLVPAGIDVLDTLLDVLEEQAGGFYDPRSKRLYLVEGMPRSMTEAFSAHELTHALDDQYFDIDARLAKVQDDDDASFALSAVAEGGASLAMASFIIRGMSAGTTKTEDLESLRASEAGRAKRLDAMPGVLRKGLLGPYVLGALFLSRGPTGPGAQGFPKQDVDTAWKSAPRSSEQILHPEKYWDAARRDDPKPVAIPDATPTLGEGWVRAGHGVLGELTIGDLVGAPAPESHDEAAMVSAASWTNAAASGWGGDRWELWTRPAGAVVLLKTVWDTPADAGEFAAALPTRAGLAFAREGSVVAIVAGDAGGKAAALLHLLSGAPPGSPAAPRTTP